MGINGHVIRKVGRQRAGRQPTVGVSPRCVVGAGQQSKGVGKAGAVSVHRHGGTACVQACAGQEGGTRPGSGGKGPQSCKGKGARGQEGDIDQGHKSWGPSPKGTR